MMFFVKLITNNKIKRKSFSDRFPFEERFPLNSFTSLYCTQEKCNELNFSKDAPYNLKKLNI